MRIVLKVNSMYHYAIWLNGVYKNVLLSQKMFYLTTSIKAVERKLFLTLSVSYYKINLRLKNQVTNESVESSVWKNKFVRLIYFYSYKNKPIS